MCVCVCKCIFHVQFALNFESAETKNRQPALIHILHILFSLVPALNLQFPILIAASAASRFSFDFICAVYDSCSLFFFFFSVLYIFHIWFSFDFSFSLFPSTFLPFVCIASLKDTDNIVTRARIYIVWNRSEMDILEWVKERKKMNHNKKKRREESVCAGIFRFNTKFH